MESLDSGDTRTTEEEGAKNDEIQPEDDTPQVQLEEEGDQLETKNPTSSGMVTDIQYKRESQLPHYYQ